ALFFLSLFMLHRLHTSTLFPYTTLFRSYKAYLKEPKYDTFTLQFVSFIAINYLNCCYHQHVDNSYTTSTFEFLQKLPPDPAIGLEKMIGRFYQTVFADTKEKAGALKDIIGECGYDGIIDDIKI